MVRKFLLSLFVVFSVVSAALAQRQQISGNVSDVKGTPIFGAAIIVEGTSLGTTSDSDGKFAIAVPANGTISVSYIGFETQNVPVAGRTQFNIVLEEDATALDEVVVTAMGISKDKKALGYAVQDVKSEDLAQAANTSLAGALQGKVAGVEITPSSGMPGASSQIQIRGARSFTGDNTPLYVVDGMPISSAADMDTGSSVTGSDYANRAIDIDPNDIESINILKGQAASALYGMRASNGVIIITTKSGKGVAKGKPQITISSNFSADVVSTVLDTQSEFGQGNGAYDPNSSLAWGPKISDLDDDPVYGGNTVNDYTNEYGMHENQYYVPQRATAGLDPWAYPQAYDNIRGFFNTGYTWSNNIGVVQAFDKSSYAFSLGNSTSEGIINNTGMDRYNAKLTAKTNLNDNWSTGFVGNFVTSSISKQASGNDGIVATVYGAPASYDLMGIPYHAEDAPYTQVNYRPSSPFDSARWATEHNSFTEDTDRFFGNAYAQYSTDFGSADHKLDLKYQIGVDTYSSTYRTIFGYGHANGKGEITNEVYAVTEMNSLFTANYNWAINDDMNFSALYGNEIVNSSTNDTYSYGMNFNFGGWNHMNNASVYNSAEAFGRSRTIGNFGSLSLDYKDMLFLNVTGRNDIVSSMPRGSRSFFYPSVSLGFIFTQIDALKNDVLTYGKIRGSFAEVGQAGKYYPSYYRTPSYGGGFSSGTPIMYPIGSVVAFTPSTTIYDSNLKPQNTQSYEVGADLSFFSGIVSLNYTFSRQNVIDQIFDIPLAGSTGSGSFVTNGGSIRTNAHELTVNINPIRKENFKWDLGFNFTQMDNRVLSLADGVDNIFLGGFVDPQVRAGIGDEFPVLYGTSYLRNDDGQIVVDEDGLPQSGGEAVIGRAAADFNLGFNTTFEIHKFRLSAVFDWKQGGQMYAGTYNVANYYGVTQESADLRKVDSFIFKEEAVKVVGQDDEGNDIYAKNDIAISGDDAYYYFDRMSGISEGGIYDNSYLKLREISLSRTFNILDKVDLTANIFARNILLWTNLEGGLDPEAAQGNNNMAGCFERFSLPGTSSYGLGLTVKF